MNARVILALLGTSVVAAASGIGAAALTYWVMIRNHFACEPMHGEHVALPGESIQWWMCSEGLVYAGPTVAAGIAGAFLALIAIFGMRVYQNRARPSVT